MLSQRCIPVLWLVLVLTVFPQGAHSLRAQSPTQAVRSAPDSESGHERMLRLLKQVKERSSIENTYIGEAAFERDLQSLQNLPADASAPERARLHTSVGEHALRLGRNQEAIEHLLQAYELSDKSLARPLFRLAVAYLRLGETENCLHHPSADRCILPIRGGGIHEQKAGSRKAIEYLGLLLKRQPTHLAARWLLNIAHMTVGEYPDEVPETLLVPPEAFESPQPFPRLMDVAPKLGLNTLSLSGGAIADDFDNDGWLDIVVSGWHPADQLRYFRNNGDGTFSERTEEAGFVGLFGGLNLKQADYDNDGDIDIYVLRGAWLAEAGRIPNSLLENDGKARFRDVTFDTGLGEDHFPTQTADWADYDNDGDLDLYVGNEVFPGQLFRNNGDRTFTDVAKSAGVENGDIAKGVTWGDYDGDRLSDLYVSNLGGANRLYHNNGDGTFTDVAMDLDVAFPFKSLPVWFWDYNNDGALDLFVPSYERRVEDIAADYLGLPVVETELDSLYEGDGKGGFREVAADRGLTRITQPMGSNFGDLDNDGYLDFYLGTGYPAYEGLMPNLFFHNQAGKAFADVTMAAGLGHLQKGHGIAFADFDHDGDQDLLIELGGAYPGDAFTNALFENPGFGNHWLWIRLIGVKSNRFAIGARIHARFSDEGNVRSVYRWVNSGGSFGANPLRQHLGLGKAESIDLLEIFWPTTGETQQFREVSVNRLIEITEGESEYRTVSLESVSF